MKTFIYFVRHAISPFSLDNERSRGLSEQGKSDSIRVAEILETEGIDIVVSSSFARAIDTVQPLADILDKEIILFEELVERSIASLKHVISEVELLDGIEKSFVDLDYCLPEGETTRQAQDRAIPIIKQLLTDYVGKKIVIGTHGNILTIILNYFDKDYGYDFWLKASKPDVYKVEFEGIEIKHFERLYKP
jgi:2,3-bisphosphoglycerate-dependent phosphoglycerate mutase